jgi:hypothetical protein
MNSSDFHEEKTALSSETSSGDPPVASPSQAVQETEKQEQSPSVSHKAKEASKSFKELIESLGKKAQILTSEKTQKLKEKTTDKVEKGIRKDDIHDLQALGINVDILVTVFEETMNQIETQYSYEEQEKLLSSYKKLLEEQINVIKTRSDMVKRLKI